MKAALSLTTKDAALHVLLYQIEEILLSWGQILNLFPVFQRTASLSPSHGYFPEYWKGHYILLSGHASQLQRKNIHSLSGASASFRAHHENGRGEVCLKASYRSKPAYSPFKTCLQEVILRSTQ